MEGEKTLYVLVFWMKSKTKSIVPYADLCPKVPEGEVTWAVYRKDQKKYKVKVLEKSYDQQYLRRLNVNVEGELMKNKRKMNIDVENKMNECHLEKKTKKKLKADSALEYQKKMLNIRPIFEESNSDSDIEQEEMSESERELKKQGKQRDTRETEKRGEQMEVRREREKEQEQKIHRENYELSRERERHIEEREKHLEERERQLRERFRKEEKERQREKQRQEQRERQEERERQGERGFRDGSMESTASDWHDENVDNTKDDEDPLMKYQRAGNGRTQLCDVYNVWIDKGDLCYLQRWYNSPKEMTRRLLKILVGSNNLKTMCARGRSKKARPIPKEILSSVEYYVNRKCSSKLEPAQFTNVVNMMCATLRNPKK